jgi:hypothetical protein
MKKFNFMIKRSKLLLFAAVSFVFTNSAHAQSELLVTASTTHFLGDLGGKPGEGSNGLSDINFSSTRWMAGIGFRKYVTGNFAFRGNFYHGRLSADDKFSGEETRRNRNLNFFSPITGANLILELHFGNNNKWYVFGGAEYFMFNPKTKYQGQTIELQKLGTEGQYFLAGKSPYQLQSFAIPMGIGYKFLTHSRGHWSFEINGRKTFADYIDDVSGTYADKTQLLASNGQTAVDLSDRSLGLISDFSTPGRIRGNPRNNDNFFFMSINYVHRLGTGYGRGKGKGMKNRHGSRCFQF